MMVLPNGGCTYGGKGSVSAVVGTLWLYTNHWKSSRYHPSHIFFIEATVPPPSQEDSHFESSPRVGLDSVSEGLWMAPRWLWWYQLLSLGNNFINHHQIFGPYPNRTSIPKRRRLLFNFQKQNFQKGSLSMNPTPIGCSIVLVLLLETQHKNLTQTSEKQRKTKKVLSLLCLLQQSFPSSLSRSNLSYFSIRIHRRWCYLTEKLWRNTNGSAAMRMYVLKT